MSRDREKQEEDARDILHEQRIARAGDDGEDMQTEEEQLFKGLCAKLAPLVLAGVRSYTPGIGVMGYTGSHIGVGSTVIVYSDSWLNVFSTLLCLASDEVKMSYTYPTTK